MKIGKEIKHLQRSPTHESNLHLQLNPHNTEHKWMLQLAVRPMPSFLLQKSGDRKMTNIRIQQKLQFTDTKMISDPKPRNNKIRAFFVHVLIQVK